MEKTSLQPRSIEAQEFNKVLSFLNKNLRPQSVWSIDEEYPLAISPTNLKNLTIIEKDNEIVSHALVKKLIIKTPMGLLKVAAIGSVVTNENFRHQGLSHSILNTCLENAQKEECDLAILWTDLYDFYNKLGFELAGFEHSFIIDRPLPSIPKNLKIIESNKVSADAILKIYSQHTVTSLRTATDIQKCLKIPNSKVYTAWDSFGQLKAYAIEGKGADLVGYIHEWGGMVSDLIELMNHIYKVQNKPITLIAAHHNQGLIRKLNEFQLTSHAGFLGMIKILNIPSMIKKIKTYAANMQVQNFIFEQQNNKFVIGNSLSQIILENESDLARFLFGPFVLKNIHQMHASTRNDLNKIFPLPFWIWGWDSV